MTDTEILNYVENTNLPLEDQERLYDELMIAPSDAEREVIKQKYNPKYTVAKDAAFVQTPPTVISTNPNDPGYWEKLSSQQLMDVAMKDPFSGVQNPDGSFNQQAYGKWVGRLADESIAQKRKNIANGDYEGAHWLEKVGAFAGGMFTPRMHEAHERGEEASWKDVALDAAQNVAYALPVGMAAGAITRGLPLWARLGAAGVSNFAVPAVMEGLDRIAYNGEENTDRSRFSLNDVLVGGAVNLGTPLFIKGAGAALGSTIGGMEKGVARDVAEALRNFGVDPKAKALETIREAEASIAAKEVPATAIQGETTWPWINLDALGAEGANMEVRDALNTAAVGRGIEDGSIKFIPTKGKVRVDAPEHITDENGILRKLGADTGDIGVVDVDGKLVHSSPRALRNDIEWANAEDFTAPNATGRNQYPTEGTIVKTLESHPELVGMDASMPRRIYKQAPMTYLTNMMGKSEYAKKAESGIPLLSEAIEETAKNEREARWASGKVTFEEQHSPEYQKWWMNRQLGL